jgi:hypothetical protein
MRKIVISISALSLSFLLLVTAVVAWFVQGFKIFDISIKNTVVTVNIELYRADDPDRDGFFAADDYTLIEPEAGGNYILTESNLFPGDIVSYKLVVKNENTRRIRFYCYARKYLHEEPDRILNEAVFIKPGTTAARLLVGVSDELTLANGTPNIASNATYNFLFTLKFGHLDELVAAGYPGSPDNLNAYQNKTLRFDLDIRLEQ